MNSMLLSAWQGLRQLIHRAQPYPDDEVLAGKLRAMQLKLSAKLAIATIPFQLFCAFALAWSNWDINPFYCLAWSGAMMVVCAWSVWHMRSLRQIETTGPSRLHLATFTIVVMACLWGSFPLLTLTHANIDADVDILLVAVCITSIGRVVFQSIPFAASAWVLVMTTATVVAMWSDSYHHVHAIAGVAVLYVGVLLRNIWVMFAEQFASLQLTYKAQRMAQSLSQHAHVAHNTSNGVLLLDANGCITWVNDGFSRRSGYSLQEALGRSPTQWLSDEDKANFLRTFRRTLQSKNEAQTEICYQGKHGRKQWAHVDIKCMKDAHGCVESYVLIGTDITDLKRATQALEIEKDRQRHIIDGTHCGTWEMDADGGVCKLGGHWLDIIGVDTTTPLVAEGAFLLDRIHPEDLPGQRRAIGDYLRGKVPRFVHEHRIRHDDGSWRWISVSGKASAFNATGQFEQMSGAVQDITERKETEIALIEATRLAKQANNAKSLFLATMSHEIRTPMNGVIGTAEWLKVTRLTEEQQDGIQTIVDSGRALLTIIDDILDFTKIDAARLKMEAVPVSLVALAEGVADAIEPVAKAKRVDFHVFVDPRLPSHVLGDPVRLRQVLFNLAGNAVKFGGGTEQRWGQVDMQVLMSDDDMQSWQVVVSDDGIGMTPDTLGRLFKPFTQADADTTRRFGGTGLGLAICHRLVELMGGGIVAHSVPGHGSTFIATLPLCPVDAGFELPAAMDLSDIDCLLLPGRNFRSDSFAAYLEHVGARVHHCIDIEDAWAIAGSFGPVVMIRDTPDGDVENAPWMNGAQVPHAEQVRHLLVGRNLHGPLRIIAPQVGQLGRAHVQDVLRAVAVLAGRRSPEVVRDGVDEFRGNVGSAVSPSLVAGHILLVAEDDPTNQKVIKRQLHMLGYACEVAGDGEAALNLWRTGRYALLLSDLHMPLMDGYDLANKIREEEAQQGLARMPILALTANALKGEEARALDCGMDAYLTKPIALDELRGSLLNWLPAPSDDFKPDGHDAADAATTHALVAMQQAGSIDINVLRALVGDDEDTLTELLLDFEASSIELGEALRQALAHQALDQIRQLAHQLKSAARSVGAMRLGELCEIAEHDVRSQLPMDAPISDLLAELEQVHVQLAEFTREPTK